SREGKQSRAIAAEQESVERRAASSIPPLKGEVGSRSEPGGVIFRLTSVVRFRTPHPTVDLHLRGRYCLASVSHPVIYYVRHGLTDWNVEQRLQGRHDIALNQLGRAQALECGEILSALFATCGLRASEFAYVASPLIRARQTMELMRLALGLEPKQYEMDE